MQRIARFKICAALIAAVIAGCASNPQQQTMDRLAIDRQQMDEARGQVDRTMYALDNLVRAPAAEIPSAQAHYATNVATLRKTTDQLNESAKEMRARKIDYLTEWERAQLNVENADLKRASEQRRKEVVLGLTELEAALRGANDGIEPLVAELEDIERVTRHDPTPAGIAAVKKSRIVQTAQKHAATAGRRLDVAASRFDRTLASLSPQPGTRPVTTAATPPATPTQMTTFQEADRNASGVIEQDEARDISGLNFPSADRDRDGKLSEVEYEAARRARSPIGANPNAQ